MKKLGSVRDVAERHLCTGCGACAYLEPDVIRMVDDVEVGLRPVVADGGGRESLTACPGVEIPTPPRVEDSELSRLRPGWGPVLEVWEGHSTDEVVRHRGSSGGVATALGMFAVEAGGYAGVLHIRARADQPHRNETVLSTDVEQVAGAVGSRYAPASPCDGLSEIEQAEGPCVFVGKPCDVAGARAAAGIRPALAERLGLTVAIFCAGTPSTRGTMKMLEVMGVDDPAELQELRYRGHGWPGMAAAARTDGGATRELTYQESWGEILQEHRQWRCRLCADHTGEHADISVGDPWYRELEPGEPGRSLVIVRTARGREALRAAMASGHLSLEQIDPELLPASQPSLLRTRGSVWGRITTLALLGLPAPRYPGVSMFRYWLKLSLKAKLQSVIGTARRVRRRGLDRARPVVEASPIVEPGGGE